MLQLILHLIGDYVTQNGWMANNKTKEWFPAIVHGVVYSIPFLIFYGWLPFIPICLTHIILDHTRAVKYLLRVKEWNFENEWGYDTTSPDAMPPYMWMWLMIIADNTVHLTINYVSIYLLG